MKLAGHSGDFLSGVLAAINTMSAVFAAQQTGVGQHIDCPEQEAVASIVCHEIGDYFDAGITYQRDAGNTAGKNLPNTPAPTALL